MIDFVILGIGIVLFFVWAFAQDTSQERDD